ncbi:hypothetical protein FFWV33_16625 [Flavobacterium faecale]|uniref:Uncharacterized protein n=1 Tax=Flavobacterium faecale TaxID=1355330 RepID=A0A2S1LH06_9FLAO|nr:hypothetical protein [Flavobacterium faecale]AWG23034.1 hypothetical protein FFWV33_16625 [Flavobacterium faecale]
MNDVNLLSKDHFAAHQQVVSDYKLLLICENELTTYSGREKNPIYARLRNEMIVLLQRIILNKNIIAENTKADQDYLQTLTNVKYSNL